MYYNVLQRDIEIEVESYDSNGNIYGHVYIDKKNMGVVLLEEGFGYIYVHTDIIQIHTYTDKYIHIYKSAETVAKTQKRGIWNGKV